MYYVPQIRTYLVHFNHLLDDPLYVNFPFVGLFNDPLHWYFSNDLNGLAEGLDDRPLRCRRARHKLWHMHSFLLDPFFVHNYWLFN